TLSRLPCSDVAIPSESVEEVLKVVFPGYQRESLVVPQRVRAHHNPKDVRSHFGLLREHFFYCHYSVLVFRGLKKLLNFVLQARRKKK
ncbi:unnamed protein product, partial [Oikopleura dioica]